MKKFITIVAMIFAISMTGCSGKTYNNTRVLSGSEGVLTASVSTNENGISCNVKGYSYRIKESRNYTITIYNDPIANFWQFAKWRNGY